jgi:hypothetical protein
VAVRPLDIRIPFHFGVIAAQGRPMRPLVAKLIAAVERIARARIKGFEVLDPKQAGQLFPAGAETAHAH